MYVMEVTYDDPRDASLHHHSTHPKQPSTQYTLQQSQEDVMHTPPGASEAYRSLFGGNPPNREQLLSALAHATEEHEAAQQAIQQSELRYRRLFEASKDSIVIVNVGDLTVIDANHAAERLFGLTRQNTQGCPVTSLSPLCAVPGITTQLHMLVNQQTAHQEITVGQADGTQEHLDIVASIYTEHNLEVAQLNIRDITDRKNNYQLETKAAGLIAERQELIAVNSAKDEFISVASHQLRTPATAVKQYLGLLLQGYVGRLTRDQRHTLERAYSSNERQLKIINDLLLVARVDAGKVVLHKEPTNLTGLIRDTVEEQSAALNRRHQSICLNLPRTLKVPVDARFLRMVIENLLSNASKYSPEGSPITISGSRDRKQVHIAVSDEGFGISASDQSKLYQKFSRIYNERATTVEGTGLGLYWCKKVIELHNGTLELTSELNRGSTFTVNLPVAQARRREQ
jgi:PAS domain S-box-containing protein